MTDEPTTDWTRLMPTEPVKTTAERIAEESAEDPWGPVTPDDVERVLKAIEAGANGSPNRQVCVCGHAAAAHTDYASARSTTHNTLRDQGQKACTPGNGWCECQNFVWVLSCSDTRLFRHATKGPDEMHALRLGTISARSKHKTIEFNPDLKCFLCPEGSGKGVRLYPLALTRSGYESRVPTQYNTLLCAEHRASVAAAARRGEVDLGA